MSERELLLQLADDELVVGWRDSEWTGIAPFLEEDVALSSIAQNEIGHARAIYELLSEDADALAFDREPDAYVCAPLVELHLVPDWARTIARRVLYEAADEIASGAASRSRATPTSRGSPPRSTAKRPTTGCTRRCGPTGWRASRAIETAVEELFPYALGVVDRELRPALAERIGLAEVEAVERGTHIAEWTALWEEMTVVRRSVPGAAW